MHGGIPIVQARRLFAVVEPAACIINVVKPTDMIVVAAAAHLALAIKTLAAWRLFDSFSLSIESSQYFALLAMSKKER